MRDTYVRVPGYSFTTTLFCHVSLVALLTVGGGASRPPTIDTCDGGFVQT